MEAVKKNRFLLIFLIYKIDIFSVKRYDYIVNGEALAEIKEYVKEEHTFAEYQEVNYHIMSYIVYTFVKF